MKDPETLRQGIETLGIELDEDTQARLLAYLELLRRWNRKIRLVGDADRPDAVDIILVDSLAPLLAVDARVSKIVDIGSGAGLPGVLLAIARPDIAITTLEPIHKKHAFQRTARRELDLNNLEPRCERIEDHPGDRIYDLAVSRATFAPAEWIERGRALVGANGRVVAMTNRSEDVPEECRAISYQVAGRTRVLAVRDRADDGSTLR